MCAKDQSSPIGAEALRGKGQLRCRSRVTVLGTLLWPFHLAIMPAVGVGVAGGGLLGGDAILLWKYLVNCGITPRSTPEKAQRFLNIERESLPKLRKIGSRARMTW
ncbi:hypothetical protein TNCV_1101511 [Trichonephila clavipes]|nr:hypothetical protein TNCV_1101511 [Trichonephila clavipes]